MRHRSRPGKAKAIREIASPKKVNQLKVIKKVSYLHRFILVLAELLKLFQKLLKKDVSFKWAKEQQTAF